MEETETDDECTILYDLFVLADWPQEPEYLVSQTSRVSDAPVKDGQQEKQKSMWSWVRGQALWRSLPSIASIPQALLKVISSRLAWQLAIDNTGQMLAVLQETSVEIHVERDNFATVKGRSLVPKDPYPQFRKLVWSSDSTFVAMSTSYGNIMGFDLLGNEKFTIETVPVPEPGFVDLSQALCALVFVDCKDDTQWSTELLAINYQGKLQSYLISITGDFIKNYCYSFISGCPQGVATATYDKKHSLLILGSSNILETDNREVSQAQAHGITAWRKLSGHPYFKALTDFTTQISTARRMSLGMRNVMRTSGLLGAHQKQDGICKLCLSANESVLAALHWSGALSLWQLPSLRRKQYWPVEQQSENTRRNETVIGKEPIRQGLADINFWSDSALILAWCNGNVTISSAISLNNLIGESHEWMHPMPQVLPAFNEGFIALECEAVSGTKRQRDDSLSGRMEFVVEDEEDDDDEYENASYLQRGINLSKRMMYFVTESERFQPPRKKPKLVTRTYRLLQLKKTTPAEFFSRKIENEEYGEALILGQKYNLDTDQVYQHQWRKNRVTKNTIYDYLNKIQKQSWVLRECLTRVPEDLEAAEELLQYGLRRTQLKTILDMDSQEYQSLQEDDDDDDDDDLDNSSDLMGERLQKKEQSLLKEINFSKLTFEQMEVLRCRIKLLMYLDRLKTYEAILGGGETALRKYDKDFFDEFRTKNIVEAAIDYAQNSECDALHVLFTYHGSDLLPHRLLILGNIPETTPPHDYENLLPVICGENRAVEWEEYTHREGDWSESSPCQAILYPNPIDYGAFLYEEDAEVKRFRCVRPSHDLLRDWYLMRAREMDEYASQVDNALDLLNIAMSGQIKGLEEVYDDLQTLSMLVYECQTDPGLSLARLQKMSDLEKMKLMMSKSTLEMYVKNYRKWIACFLDQCEIRHPGKRNKLTKEYLVDMAKEDLTICKLIFENSKPGQVANPIISDSAFLTEVALDVLYACDRTDQLNIAIQIASCITPTKPISRKKAKGETGAVDKLDTHLQAQELLQRHQIEKTLRFLKETEQDEEEATKIMIRLTRQAAKRKVLPDQKEWHQLLEDLLNLQRNVYSCIKQETCHEIYVQGLLGSNHLPTIRLAEEVLSPAKEGPESRGRIGYERSSSLTVEAAREYFNSSANLMDPSMGLARSCLQIMKDIPDVIQQELDLVASLALLDDFKVSVLPLQVRLCEDRLELVAEALESSPNAYKDLRKLTKLAKLLRICGGNEMERKGKVFSLITKKAMKVNDYKLAYQVCSELVADNYSAIWPVCRQLGEAPDFKELEAKSGLLAFAVSHCDPDNLLDILLSKTQLETQILYQRLGNLAEDQGGESEEDVTMDTQNDSAGLAKSLLSSVSGMSWGSVKGWIRPLMHQQSSVSSDSDRHGNQAMEQQGCHPFYEDVISGALLDKTSMQYDRFVTSSGDAYPRFLQQSMLRASLMSDGQMLTLPDSHVLLQLCSEWLPVDATLALSYLLSLPKATDAHKCLRSLPHSVISLQLGAYFYALQIYSHQHPCNEAGLADVFTKSPSDLILEVSEGNRLQGEEAKNLYEQLDWFLKLLADVVQAEMLRSLGKGVDVSRFSSDDEYKQETILGLVMTLDEEVYNIAVSLAHRYQVSLWELHCTYLEFLFTDSGLSTEEVEEKIKSKEILGPLLSKPNDFHARLISSVYPTLDGRDHSRLLYYFTLLNSCGVQEGDGLNPDTQLKLLKKLKSAAFGLDYKALTDGEADPMEVIQPTLNSSNVHVFAKNASKIPKPGGGFLDPEAIFSAHILKLFWEGDQGIKEAPQSMADWLKRFEACKEYFSRVSTKEVVSIIRNIVFSKQSLEKLDVECRENIIRRGVKSIQQQGGKKKGPVAGDLEEQQQLMKQYLKHITSVQDSSIQMLVNSDKDMEVEYALEYDLSAGDVDKLAVLLTKMAVNGLDVTIINNIIKLTDWKKPTKVVYQESLQSLLNSLRCSSLSDFNVDKQTFSTQLKNLLDSVTRHEENSGDLLKIDDILPKLQDFCRDVGLQQSKRLLVIDATEQFVERIYQELADRHYNLACLKVALLTSHGVVHRKAFEFMSGIDEVTDDIYDDELLELLIACDKVASFVNTKFYPVLVDHVTEKNRRAIPGLTKQLYHAGYKGEAGTLYMSYKGSNNMLWTLNTAMASVSNFMKKFTDG
ncbi:neuroblastoma-amplified sequence-like [Anneissia japonica]|uniref:neuroblastoma-amplified sequence-like n=1 Tax=Anneissia japonica TaxID=1529436 RepID=UPI0014256867|nr:neuroblastoma-amplified sequence-like [Anneissia japonica]